MRQRASSAAGRAPRRGIGTETLFDRLAHQADPVAAPEESVLEHDHRHTEHAAPLGVFDDRPMLVAPGSQRVLFECRGSAPSAAMCAFISSIESMSSSWRQNRAKVASW